MTDEYTIDEKRLSGSAVVRNIHGMWIAESWTDGKLVRVAFDAHMTIDEHRRVLDLIEAHFKREQAK